MIVQLLAAILLFGLCIFFHELGHFLIGKWMGVRAKIFSIGYGRGIWFKKIGRTIYQVTAIPLGGYVQFYGDDITKKHENIKKGDFFSVGPWRRIALAFGGPFFSLLLGFLVIFFLIVFGWQPMTNEITFPANVQTPAIEAGLQKGDKIIAVNGQTTNSFEKIGFYVGLSSSETINVKIDRKGQKLEKVIKAKRNRSNGLYSIGVQPKGESYVLVTPKKKPAQPALKEHDRIINVNGKRVHSVTELQKALLAVLDKGENTAKVDVDRKAGGFFSPTNRTRESLILNVTSAPYFLLENVTDLQTGKTIPSIPLRKEDGDAFKKISIDSKSFSTWSDFSAYLNQEVKVNAQLKLTIGTVPVTAQLVKQPRGLLGFIPAQYIDAQKAAHPTDIGSILTRTVDTTVFLTTSTLMGLYRLIQGKLSFQKSVSGPIKIFKVAHDTVETGWDNFWFLLANITIILGIMNLLPIPVLDGGHIVFYLIEAIYNPLPVKVIASSVRVGMVLLLSLGVFVIFNDLFDVLRGWP